MCEGVLTWSNPCRYPCAEICLQDLGFAPTPLETLHTRRENEKQNAPMWKISLRRMDRAFGYQLPGWRMSASCDVAQAGGFLHIPIAVSEMGSSILNTRKRGGFIVPCTFKPVHALEADVNIQTQTAFVIDMATQQKSVLLQLSATTPRPIASHMLQRVVGT